MPGAAHDGDADLSHQAVQGRCEEDVRQSQQVNSEASGEPADGAGDCWEGLYRGEMKAQRVILLVGGVVLLLVGVLWTLQGVGAVGGSAMSGVTLWAIVGPIVALVGAYLLWRASRRTLGNAKSSGPPTPSS